MRETFWVAVLIMGMAGVPFSGAADTIGGSGKLAGLRQVEPTSDDFPRFHGAIIIDEGKNVITSYFWGGSHCPGFDLEDARVAVLLRALRNTKLRALVAYKPGAGGTRCLTQYLLVDKKFEDDVVFP